MLTVGEILKQEREKKGIALSDLEKKIRVRRKFLEALEDNRWEHFPSKIYIVGVIKNYARYIGLDTERALAFFRRDYERRDTVRFKKRVASRYLAPETRRLAVGAVAGVFFFFLLYFGFQVIQFISPPRVEIISPKQITFKNEERIKIVGKTQKESTVNIFGERVFLNREGVFEYEFPLHKGKNKLVIEVVGPNGKKQTLNKEYIKER